MTTWNCPDCGGGPGQHDKHCPQHISRGPAPGAVVPIDFPGQAIIQERAKIRGDFSDQSQVSQDLKDTLRGSANFRDDKLNYGQREALEHILEKIARLATGDPNEIDAWADISGYATLIHNKLTGGKHVK